MATDIIKYDGLSRLGTTVYASAARTATPNSQEFEIGSGWMAATVVIDTTAAGVSPSTVVKVSGVDRLSGKVYDLLSSAAITATGTVSLAIGQSLTAAANVSANAAVPPVLRVTSTHGNGTSHTYSVALILS
jgi:hypothetical protein